MAARQRSTAGRSRWLLAGLQRGAYKQHKAQQHSNASTFEAPLLCSLCSLSPILLASCCTMAQWHSSALLTATDWFSVQSTLPADERHVDVVHRRPAAARGSAVGLHQPVAQPSQQAAAQAKQSSRQPRPRFQQPHQPPTPRDLATDQQLAGQSPSTPKHTPRIQRVSRLISPAARRVCCALLQFVLPFVVNQCGSALFLRLLSWGDVSLVVPLTNSLTFVCTAVTSIALGEQPHIHNTCQQQHTEPALPSSTQQLLQRSSLTPH